MHHPLTQHPGGHGQQGFSTLLAAVFLLSGILLLGALNLQQTGADTAAGDLARDAAASLYLAESAVERAAAAYARGSDCRALVSVRPLALGNGRFRLVAARPTAEGCRIEALGEVPRTIGAPARRRLAVVLHRAGTGSIHLAHWHEVLQPEPAMPIPGTEAAAGEP